MKLLHILCTSDNYYLSLVALLLLFTTVLVFHQEKNWFCWKCVINYEVRSAIVWDFMQRGMVILTNTVLLDLGDGTSRLSRNISSQLAIHAA